MALLVSCIGVEELRAAGQLRVKTKAFRFEVEDNKPSCTVGKATCSRQRKAGRTNCTAELGTQLGTEEGC
eukprot:646641-Heterocapsa_arctica.AAC.1